jgi:chemotaxis protein CheD
MSSSDDIMDVFLHPGDLYFGDAETRMRTILGSCVTITMWHPQRRIGGMSHCLLPGSGRRAAVHELDGKYVDEALDWLLHEARRHKTRPKEYQFKLFGGSDMFAKASKSQAETIGRQNAVRAISIFEKLKLDILTHDIGGTVSRSLIFEVATGDVWIRHGVKRQLLPKLMELNL